MKDLVAAVKEKRQCKRYCAIWIYPKLRPGKGVLVTTRHPQQIMNAYERYFVSGRQFKDRPFDDYGKEAFTLTNDQCPLRHINYSVRRMYAQEGYPIMRMQIVHVQPLPFTHGQRRMWRSKIMRHVKSKRCALRNKK